MLNATAQQSETVKMDIIFDGLSQESKNFSENLHRLGKILDRLEEQTPTESLGMPPKPQAYGPGHLYRLNSLFEESASNNKQFNELLTRLSRYI